MLLQKLQEKMLANISVNFFDNHTDINQSGCVHGRSTTQALLKVMHDLFPASDCSQNISRILFVDI